MESSIGPTTTQGPPKAKMSCDAAGISVRMGRKEAGEGSSPHTDVGLKEPVYLVISIVKWKAQVSSA